MPDESLPRGKKKDTDAPRGVSRHRRGGWAIRFTCGAGCKHKERVGPLKSEAIRLYYDCRNRALSEPGWCPNAERRETREHARARAHAEANRVTFRQYAEKDYLPWAKLHHRGWRTEECRIVAMAAAFGDVTLDALTTAEVEKFLDGLLTERSQSTRNRYRTLLHALLNRAKRHGRLSANPVQGISKFREPEGRTLYLTAGDEATVREALAPQAMATGRPSLDERRTDLRPLFTVSVHTGLRWSEERALQWADVDFLTGLITVRRSKSGYSRQVPMNSMVRSTLIDLGSQRTRPDNSEESVFRCSYTSPDKFFPKAVERARKVLVAAGKEAGRLDGYTWHCNRHTFASRLVMAGVDLRTIQVLGGWRTLAMVQRYSHLAPEHLRAAVERLVPVPAAIEVSQERPISESVAPSVS
jgi:integrase